jgi:dCTP deaminase
VRSVSSDAAERRINPFDLDLVQPASYEVTLADDYLKQLHPEVEGWDDFREETWSTRNWIEPGDFILASTAETVHLPDDITAQVNGKSSLGRQGLTVHVTAGFIDAGFEGTITLELANLSRRTILLEPGQKIAQLAFFRMDGPAMRPYGSEGLGSHYQNQQGPTESVA